MNFVNEGIFAGEDRVSLLLDNGFSITWAFKSFPVGGGMVWRFLLLTSTVDSPRVMTLFIGAEDGKDLNAWTIFRYNGNRTRFSDHRRTPCECIWSNPFSTRKGKEMLRPHERRCTMTNREDRRWRIPDSSMRVKVMFLITPTMSKVDPAKAVPTGGPS